MARNIKQRPIKSKTVVLIDGKDEKWYIERVKKHHPGSFIKEMKLQPELVEEKKVQELFDRAQYELDNGASSVILIIDLDEPLRANKKTEYERFKTLYEKYLDAHSGMLKGSGVKKYGWMKQMTLIVNNPCLEYWYLLHEKRTTKYYADYDAMKIDLRKIPYLSDYNKSEDYYTSSPDIYERLQDKLSNARSNAQSFCLSNCRSVGCSEMTVFFDTIERANG